MTTDDDMREIEAALEDFEDFHRELWSARAMAVADEGDVRRCREALGKLLALIRQKLEGNLCQRPQILKASDFLELGQIVHVMDRATLDMLLLRERIRRELGVIPANTVGPEGSLGEGRGAGYRVPRKTGPC